MNDLSAHAVTGVAAPRDNPPRSETLFGKILGRTYRVLGRHESGGMATVFAAEHLRLRRRVAIKRIAADFCNNSKVRARFRREAAILSRLHHPHIVEVLDFDFDDDGDEQPYLVMEFLEGETLAQFLDRECPLPLAEALRITLQIASGLEAAHANGIVHRDLKPENVFLVDLPEQPTFAKILDFGIGKGPSLGPQVTQQTEMVGTPDYMAPEQVTGPPGAVGPATDQHGLALLFYEMVTGLCPFSDETVPRTLARVARERPPPVSHVNSELSEELDAVLERALAKDPSARFASVATFVAALSAACEASSPAAAPSSGKRPKNVVAEVTECLETARRCLDSGKPRDAIELIDRAISLADADSNPEAASLIRVAEPLFERIYLACLGGDERLVCVCEAPSAHGPNIGPRGAYLLSIAEEPITVADLIDIAAMKRLEGLRQVVRLLDFGMISLA